MEREKRTPNQQLRYERTNRGWSQKRVADAIDTTKELVSKWECGTQTPSKHYQEKLCLIFGKSARELGFLPADDLPVQDQVAPQLIDLAPFSESVGSESPLPDVSHWLDEDTPTSILELGSTHTFDQGTERDNRFTLETREAESLFSPSITPTPNEGSTAATISFRELQKQLFHQVITPRPLKQETITYPLSRREALLTIAALPVPFATLAHTPHAAIDIEESFSACNRGIRACWQLSADFDLLTAYSILSSYKMFLVSIFHHIPSYKKEVAHLTAQVFLLQAILGRHIEGLSVAEAVCKEAIRLSALAENDLLHVIALRHLAMIYYYEKRHKEELIVYERSISPFLHHERLPPLVHSFIYAGWAGAQALHGQAHAAQTSLILARDTFAQSSETDASPFFIDYDSSQCFISEGLTLYDLGRYQEAFETFLQVDGSSPKLPTTERGRLEFLNCQARTLLRLPSRDRDMQQCITYWKAAMEGALVLKSKQRYEETCRIYELMEFVWPYEAKIKALRDMLWEGEKVMGKNLDLSPHAFSGFSESSLPQQDHERTWSTLQ